MRHASRRREEQPACPLRDGEDSTGIPRDRALGGRRQVDRILPHKRTESQVQDFTSRPRTQCL